MRKSVRIAQSIVGTSPGRPKYDFYRTPPGATLALLEVEQFDHHIWEPACGDGAISEVLKRQGFNVISSDLIDRGYGHTQNFFSFNEAMADTIITNPPFRWAEEFVEHAKALGVTTIALLLKLTFLETQERSFMLERTKLSRVWVFRDRLTMTRNGEPSRNGGMIAYAWFVWDSEHKGPPTLGWIKSVSETDLYQLPLDLTGEA